MLFIACLLIYHFMSFSTVFVYFYNVRHSTPMYLMCEVFRCGCSCVCVCVCIDFGRKRAPACGRLKTNKQINKSPVIRFTGLASGTCDAKARVLRVIVIRL